MAYFHTNYDASTMTVSVNDEEVSRALGVLSNKTPAALKVAVNTTARQTRKLMLIRSWFSCSWLFAAMTVELIGRGMWRP